MPVYENIKQVIGHTPLVKINHHPFKDRVNIFAKLEYFNPGGSIKDRLGLKLIEEAIRTKKITADGTIIEPTAGNTGIGLAIGAKNTNVKVIFVVPEKFSQEKQVLMRALGAKVINTPSYLGMKGAIEKAKNLHKEIPNSYIPNQFHNFNNPQAYYETLAPELIEDLNGKIDIFIAGAGSGGTFQGCAAFFRKYNSKIKNVIVEPEGSILNSSHPHSHRTEGIGLEFIPPFLNLMLMDAIHTISDADAFKRVEDLAKLEGMLVGSSSGAAYEAALREAKSAPNGSNIVVIFPDGSDRYLSKGIYE